MKAKSIKVIFDTNVWISYLIGKRLSIITEYIATGKILIITTEQLIAEIKEVTGRERLRKYFPQQSVVGLIELLDSIAEKVDILPLHFINRDPKDNFLLDLIHFSKADFLVTGDKDLLVHNFFKTARILNPADFEMVVRQL